MLNNKKSIYLDDREKFGGKIAYAIFNMLFRKRAKARQEKENELLLNNVCNNNFVDWNK
ncbi:hypothetical protein SAMN05428976_10258 [Clostridium sp. USBA 49]|uniref:hypothetical protein n=1 Tax=Clostridium sp. USBA 49 TaxID=1881060 RepID=UPI0009CF32E5|nr:hypothetical protein [Clostridium sp. USBA 49]SKA75103.1 hypothetical protein SAMN05428976_10258 [Clostridium sp. USBA 49]